LEIGFSFSFTKHELIIRVPRGRSIVAPPLTFGRKPILQCKVYSALSCKSWRLAKEGSYFDSLIKHPETTYHLWGATCGYVGRLDRNYIKATGSLLFCTKFNIYFFENLNMHSSKALLGTILVAQLFTSSQEKPTCTTTLSHIKTSYLGSQYISRVG